MLKLLLKLSLFLILFSVCRQPDSMAEYDVIVLGEGTGATAAAIQSARSGAKTLWINPLEWSGGMLTAAGVSATDGNHRLPAGIWGEFRSLIHEHYGGADSVFTGWVSNTMFEPKVGHFYLEKLIEGEENLEVWKNTDWDQIEKTENWKISGFNNKKSQSVTGKILIDGTDLGDVAAQVGAGYDLGMDSQSKSGESPAPAASNDIIQDLTYAAVLKDFGKNADQTIPKPEGYDPSVFHCACQVEKCPEEEPLPCDKMLTYGKLPNEKYMINWPKHGNDFYENIVEMDELERQKVYKQAKLKTLQFIYYIQTELGYKNLGLAEDEFPTDDKLPLYPYHREGRRIHGKTQLNLNHILNPYDYSLYQTGIAVGDYPIDHHHAENEDAPKIDFPSVPSFSIPAGCLIPENIDDLIIADKAISVTNIVNGASRLQPVILQIGQAAGIMAAMSARENQSPKDLDIRVVQKEITKNKGYLLPFIDVSNEDPHFESIQKIGATGILRGKGVPFQWANQTWFYPDTFVVEKVFAQNLKSFDAEWVFSEGEKNLSIKTAVDFIFKHRKNNAALSKIDFNNFVIKNWEANWKLKNFNPKRLITKRELAVLLDKTIDPFWLKKVNWTGN